MQEFLLTHPSLFIITLTIITIMLIYIFRDKINSKYIKVEDTSMESTCSIEMQTMSAVPDIHYDEPDILTPLPNPKLYKKNHYDVKKSNTKYDVPRIHGLPSESAGANSSSKNNDNKIINNLNAAGSHLENLERKYIKKQTPVVLSSINENYENMENKSLSVPNPTYLMQPVVHREKPNKNTDNRISISEVHKHGSYVSFDGEFDQFDDLSRRSNVMRVTMDFDPDEPPINV